MVNAELALIILAVAATLFAVWLAIEGGQLRDCVWNDRVLTPRTI